MGNLGIVEIAIIAAIAIFGMSALLRAITRGDGQRGPVSDATERRIEALETEIMTLRQELSEAQERLDFTDRLLAARRDERAEG